MDNIVVRGTPGGVEHQQGCLKQAGAVQSAGGNVRRNRATPQPG